MSDELRPVGRSIAEIVIAVSAMIGLALSLFTGIRAFYVNEYRIDVLEQAVKASREDVKDVRNDIKELDRGVQRLVGAATKNGWITGK